MFILCFTRKNAVLFRIWATKCIFGEKYGNRTSKLQRKCGEIVVLFVK